MTKEESARALKEFNQKVTERVGDIVAERKAICGKKIPLPGRSQIPTWEVNKTVLCEKKAGHTGVCELSYRWGSEMLNLWNAEREATQRRIMLLPQNNHTKIISKPLPFPFITIAAKTTLSVSTQPLIIPVYRPLKLRIPFEVAEFLVVEAVRFGNCEMLLGDIDGIHFSDRMNPEHEPLLCDWPSIKAGDVITLRVRNASNAQIQLRSYFTGIYPELYPGECPDPNSILGLNSK